MGVTLLYTVTLCSRYGTLSIPLPFSVFTCTKKACKRPSVRAKWLYLLFRAIAFLQQSNHEPTIEILHRFIKCVTTTRSNYNYSLNIKEKSYFIAYISSKALTAWCCLTRGAFGVIHKRDLHQRGREICQMHCSTSIALFARAARLLGRTLRVP